MFGTVLVVHSLGDFAGPIGDGEDRLVFPSPSGDRFLAYMAFKDKINKAAGDSSKAPQKNANNYNGVTTGRVPKEKQGVLPFAEPNSN